MSRNALALLLVSFASLLVGVGMFQYMDSRGPATPAVEADYSAGLPLISFTLLDNSRRKLEDWGEPVLVVNFWAPWCAPCRREIPALVEIQKEFAGRVQILGLAVDKIENVKSFISEVEMNYPTFIAGTDIAMYNAVFGNKTGGLPFTAFLDNDRNLRLRHNGELTTAQLRANISELLQP